MSDAPTLLAERYRLGDQLGRGGMGQVWLARDETLDRDVAVKELDLPVELAADAAAARRRTLREARAAARLSHPNVVQVYDVLSFDDRTWIVMEYVPCRSLKDVIAADGPLDEYRTARIGLDLLAALRAAHRAGVQHRDVKPANVLLAEDGRVLLTDFGIAAMDDDSLTSRSDVLVGSPLYMAPERARYGTSGPEADLYSLGATLYATIEGQSPFQRTSTMATLSALATEEPDPPKHADALWPLLQELLRKDPAERIGAEDAEARLREVIARLSPSESVTTAPVIPRQRKPAGSAPVAGRDDGPAVAVPRKKRNLVAVLAAVIVAAGAVVLFVTTRGDADDQAAPQSTATTPAASAGANPGASAATSANANAGASAGASATASPSATASASSSDGRPALPSGWTDYKDKTGFSVYVPKGWTRSKSGTMVYFKNGKGLVLGIDQTDTPRSNPVKDWQGQRDSRLAAGDFPGYKEVKIASVDYFKKAADWEFTFNGSDSRQHVNNRGVVTSAHQAYGFWFQTPDSQWSASRESILQVVFDSFVPVKD
ncbi:serine/threonine-protein kinase [Actinoplanes sp. NPDC051851]|uniref:serine/threonine-protein kinase n=1 Tax=Actinoplanes sp. NPDC051851 TaxID=3154753 RepID=UPI0034480EA6